jgi:hypothetical protein
MLAGVTTESFYFCLKTLMRSNAGLAFSAKRVSQMRNEIIPRDQSGYLDDLMSLSLRPDMLVLLPAFAQFPLPRQLTRVDTSSRKTTNNPIH